MTMILKDIITTLQAEDPQRIVPIGFNRPHSYRGFYNKLAFHPALYITIGEMLESARDAAGRTFEGYKGGEYRMTLYTEVFIAEYGMCGEPLDELLLSYMLDKLPLWERARPILARYATLYTGRDFS